VGLGITAEDLVAQMYIEMEPSMQIEREARAKAGLPELWTYGVCVCLCVCGFGCVCVCVCVYM